ncbi:asparaginase [Amnibacterium endophyticum]|uniref:Asparaginase n=1 Tax=Amnibacterium endophyticum TaxID=2109337 RepID=A0ABW4LAK6_9MICO
MTGPLDAGGAALLAEVERSGFVEAQHSGAAVVVDPDGAVLASVGSADSLIYPRSALKPFQTVAALRAGAVLDERDLVIVTSSHAGAAHHVDAVRHVLADGGLTEDDLRCPVAWPSSRREAADLVRRGLGASRIAMTCSGNHAGMVRATAALGLPVADYLDPTGPVHALAVEVLREHGGAEPLHPGTDGCGGPVWAVPLVALARGYGSLLQAEPALADAIRAHPELIEGAGGEAGTTRAVERLGVAAKSGAEGVWCAVTPDGVAVAVKVLDGSPRAAAAAAVALLAGTGAVDAGAAEAWLADPSLAVRGGGAEVGRVRPLV